MTKSTPAFRWYASWSSTMSASSRTTSVCTSFTASRSLRTARSSSCRHDVDVVEPPLTADELGLQEHGRPEDSRLEVGRHDRARDRPGPAGAPEARRAGVCRSRANPRSIPVPNGGIVQREPLPHRVSPSRQRSAVLSPGLHEDSPASPSTSSRTCAHTAPASEAGNGGSRPGAMLRAGHPESRGPVAAALRDDDVGIRPHAPPWPPAERESQDR